MTAWAELWPDFAIQRIPCAERASAHGLIARNNQAGDQNCYFIHLLFLSSFILLRLYYYRMEKNKREKEPSAGKNASTTLHSFRQKAIPYFIIFFIFRRLSSSAYFSPQSGLAPPSMPLPGCCQPHTLTQLQFQSSLLVPDHFQSQKSISYIKISYY